MRNIRAAGLVLVLMASGCERSEPDAPVAVHQPPANGRLVELKVEGERLNLRVHRVPRNELARAVAAASGALVSGEDAHSEEIDLDFAGQSRADALATLAGPWPHVVRTHADGRLELHFLVDGEVVATTPEAAPRASVQPPARPLPPPAFDQAMVTEEIYGTDPVTGKRTVTVRSFPPPPPPVPGPPPRELLEAQQPGKGIAGEELWENGRQVFRQVAPVR